MYSLNELIDKFGKPVVLIDHWDKTSNRFAIWEFEETFEINTQGQGILNSALMDVDPFEVWQNTIDRWKTESNEVSAVGYISYDLKNLLFPYINFNKPKKDFPLVWFGKPKLIRKYQSSKSNKQSKHLLKLEKDILNTSNYNTQINKIKKYLMNGETYQINFTQPKYYKLFNEPFNTYRIMRESIKPHYGAYMNINNFSILSFSPERFFKTKQNKIKTYPMKGTRPRSNNDLIDKQLANELLNSQKDKAEHLMIVDLLRNDIGKICEYNSININNLYSVHSFETVHQMITQINGKLKHNIKEIEIIKALFPGGSITGAPKEESMRIIDNLEKYQRSIYTGSLGYILKNGDMDFNIAIRTMTTTNNKAVYPVGGGIIWDSNPLNEWKEAQQKSKILSPYVLKKNIKNNKIKTVSLTN